MPLSERQAAVALVIAAPPGAATVVARRAVQAVEEAAATKAKDLRGDSTIPTPSNASLIVRDHAIAVQVPRMKTLRMGAIVAALHRRAPL